MHLLWLMSIMLDPGFHLHVHPYPAMHVNLYAHTVRCMMAPDRRLWCGFGCPAQRRTHYSSGRPAAPATGLASGCPTGSEAGAVLDAVNLGVHGLLDRGQAVRVRGHREPGRMRLLDDHA